MCCSRFHVLLTFPCAAHVSMCCSRFHVLLMFPCAAHVSMCCSRLEHAFYSERISELFFSNNDNIARLSRGHQWFFCIFDLFHHSDTIQLLFINNPKRTTAALSAPRQKCFCIFDLFHHTDTIQLFIIIVPKCTTAVLSVSRHRLQNITAWWVWSDSSLTAYSRYKSCMRFKAAWDGTPSLYQGRGTPCLYQGRGTPSLQRYVAWARERETTHTM